MGGAAAQTLQLVQNSVNMGIAESYLSPLSFKEPVRETPTSCMRWIAAYFPCIMHAVDRCVLESLTSQIDSWQDQELRQRSRQRHLVIASDQIAAIMECIRDIRVGVT